MKKRKGGFTLIELLVVIAIIGVLASIVLASLNSARKKGRDARRIADLNQIRLALELYADGAGQVYPAATATCDATNAFGLQVLASVNIPAVPRDPITTVGCYKYATIGAPVTQYHLGATLEETTNNAFSGDRDCRSDIVSGCGTTAYTQGFNGLAAGCAAGVTTLVGGPGAAGTTENCYDIAN